MTLIRQLAPTGRLEPQLLVCSNSFGSPVMPMLVMASADPPPLVSVTFRGALLVWIFWLPNPRLPGDKMASAGADWQTDAATQIRWGLGYIKSVYGTPCGAWQNEVNDGFY